MDLDLFGNPQPHDTGTKVKIKLPPGVAGDAEFHGPNDCYRVRLRRWRGDFFPVRYVNFIGMNPSAAGPDEDDRTLVRDWHFTEREGYSGLVKTNIADYRLTHPSDLLKLTDPVCSDRNLQALLYEAAGASLIILCFGSLNRILKPFGDAAVRALLADNRKLMCFDVNADGSPKHTLYVKGDQPLREWRPSS